MSFINYFLLLCVISTAIPLKTIYKLKFAKNMFHDFVKTYNKSYRTEKEFKRRFNIFVQNLKYINKKNKISNTVRFGITEFTDSLAVEKHYRRFGPWSVDNIKMFNSSKMPTFTGNVPKKWDWRVHDAVTSVKNQESCEACWAICAAGAIEGRYAILHKRLVELSDKQLLDCSGQTNNCNGGLPHEAIMATTKFNGVATAAIYPYKPMKSICAAAGMEKKAVVLETSTYYLNSVNETTLKSLVYHMGPTIVAIPSGPSFQYYKHGIANSGDLDCHGLIPTHAALIVGYGTANKIPYWTLKNSLGRNWGEYGYFRLLRNANACGITNYIVSVEVQGPGPNETASSSDETDSY